MHPKNFAVGNEVVIAEGQEAELYDAKKMQKRSFFYCQFGLCLPSSPPNQINHSVSSRQLSTGRSSLNPIYLFHPLNGHSEERSLVGSRENLSLDRKGTMKDRDPNSRLVVNPGGNHVLVEVQQTMRQERLHLSKSYFLHDTQLKPLATQKSTATGGFSFGGSSPPSNRILGCLMCLLGHGEKYPSQIQPFWSIQRLSLRLWIWPSGPAWDRPPNSQTPQCSHFVSYYIRWMRSPGLL
ncbi:hypothetical protein Hypma_000666 [Hypsizygus marmoreus]|uniref:Uncharacterized protein n=1 Tax=Hypsizygus marmoreus TaxID=39966 RepID=A0A369JFR7_HYPMA|nr:hypothetical protein Hypma_000666 [Hypsizygus marmoreus]